MLVVGAYIGWQNRVNLLVWGLPVVMEVTRPVAPNVPIEWPAGPAVASQSPQLIAKPGGVPYEKGDEYFYWPK